MCHNTNLAQMYAFPSILPIHRIIPVPPAQHQFSCLSQAFQFSIHAILNSTSKINPLLNSHITAAFRLIQSLACSPKSALRVPTLSLKTNLSHFTWFDGANWGSKPAVPPVLCHSTESIHISTHFHKHV